MTRVRIGVEEVTIQAFSGRKAIRAMKILKAMSRGVPEVLEEWAAFNRAYADENAILLELDAGPLPVPRRNRAPHGRGLGGT